MKDANFKSEELLTCGKAKEFLMLVVVLYHSMLCSAGIEWGPYRAAQTSRVLYYLSQYLNRVHVYAFTFISGYIFAYLRYETNRYSNTKAVLRKKAKRLLVPYTATALLWVIPFYCYFWKPNFKEILERYILGISPNQLWFLLMLFWNFLVFELLAEKLTLQRKNIAFFLGLFTMVLYLGMALSALGVPNYFQILKAMEFFLFFYLGLLFRRLDASKYIRWYVSGGGTLVSVALFIAAQNFQLQGGYVRYLGTLLYPIVSIFAVCGFMVGILLLSRNGTNRKSLNCGMTVYLFHQQFIYISLSLFNRPWVSPIMLTLINFAFATLCSIFVHKILMKWHVTRFLFGLN